MTFVERIEVLRKRNKYLLDLLKQQGEQLMRLHGCSPTDGAEPQDGEEEWREPAEVPTGSASQDPDTAETGGTKRVQKPADYRKEQAGDQLAIPTTLHGERRQRCAGSAAVPSDGSTCPSEPRDERATSTEPRRATHSAEQKNVGIPASSRLHESDSSSDRRRSRPLRGYDWIAGILDVEDSLTERSEKFFTDLQTFGSLNKDKCVYSLATDQNSTGDCGPSRLDDSNSPCADVDTHQCVFPYRMNDRFFLIPRHSEERCPMCKMPKIYHPHTESDPALIRVSIPCSLILQAHKYKAHRRSSFDPSDGLGLPAHCLLGWSNKCPQQPLGGLDLQSNMKSSTGTQTNQVEILPAPKEVLQFSEVSRLPPFNFQHFFPKIRRPRSFHASL